METKFKYKVGDPVYNKKEDEPDWIYQKRIIHGRAYYRLKIDTEIRHEDDLMGPADIQYKRVA